MEKESTPGSCPKLATKLAKIIGEMEHVEKRGENAHFGYQYVTESDLVHAVRKKLAQANVFVFTSNERQDASLEVGDPDKPEKRARLTTVTLKHTFVCGDSGEQFTVFSQGQGADRADKGVYKATTGAMKYFIYKCFMIATGDDPENPGGEGDDDRRGEPERRQEPSHSSARPSTTSSTAEVPRAADVLEIKRLEPQFAGKKWETVVVHFGQHRGKKLYELSKGSLEAFIANWQPAPFKGKIHPDDLALRAALNVANNEWK